MKKVSIFAIIFSVLISCTKEKSTSISEKSSAINSEMITTFTNLLSDNYIKSENGKSVNIINVYSFNYLDESLELTNTYLEAILNEVKDISVNSISLEKEEEGYYRMISQDKMDLNALKEDFKIQLDQKVVNLKNPSPLTLSYINIKDFQLDPSNNIELNFTIGSNDYSKSGIVLIGRKKGESSAFKKIIPVTQSKLLIKSNEIKELSSLDYVTLYGVSFNYTDKSEFENTLLTAVSVSILGDFDIVK